MIHIEISEKEFFRKIEEVFDKGEVNVEVDNLGDIKIQVKKFDDKTKPLELKLIKEFKLKIHYEKIQSYFINFNYKHYSHNRIYYIQQLF